MRLSFASMSLPLALTLVSLPCMGIDRLRLQAASLSAEGMTAHKVNARFDILSATRSQLDIRAASVTAAPAIIAQTGAITNVHLRCANPVVRTPLFACTGLNVDAKAARWPPIKLTSDVSYESSTGKLAAKGSGLNIAGSPLAFDVHMDGAGLRALLELTAFSVPELAVMLRPWVALPEDLSVAGQGALSLDLRQTSQGARHAEFNLAVRNAGFQNAAYTWIGEKLETTLHGRADLTKTPLTFELQLAGVHGQALAGPVLLDFDKNPLEMNIAGNYAPNAVQIVQFDSRQKELAQATGTARIALDPFAVTEAEMVVTNMTFPAVYSSYLQLLLATTPFNQLVTTGGGNARVAIVNNVPTQFDLTIHDLAFSDAKRALKVDGVSSELHWTAGATGPPRPSWFAWENSQGWGIIGAKSRLDFVTSDLNFRLLKAARLPFFDGALIINTLSAENIGRDDMSGVFDANIDPISVGPIAKAFGLPEFSGQLSGRIPGLTYKDRLLTLQGNFEADVFDGRVVASNLRVREPLSAWPRMYADITARNLDLDLITRTFEFGSITGRLDVDLLGLETFNWSPVAFDLKMATPAGDRSKHRISQRAVQNLSNIGGGGGGVAAALQSGALKFFDKFGYARLGLSCRLRNDVCQMSGVGKAGTGFYIVKGKGVPSINIIGNNQRVDWPRLMTQIADAMANPEGIAVR